MHNLILVTVSPEKPSKINNYNLKIRRYTIMIFEITKDVIDECLAECLEE
jgi:hypothetical protein